MNWQTFLEPETSTRICLTLLHSLWQVSLAALLAAAVSRLWRNKSVERNYLVHVAALVVAFLAVPVTFLVLPAGEREAACDSCLRSRGRRNRDHNERSRRQRLVGGPKLN